MVTVFAIEDPDIKPVMPDPRIAALAGPLSFFQPSQKLNLENTSHHQLSRRAPNSTKRKIKSKKTLIGIPNIASGQTNDILQVFLLKVLHEKLFRENIYQKMKKVKSNCNNYKWDSYNSPCRSRGAKIQKFQLIIQLVKQIGYQESLDQGLIGFPPINDLVIKEINIYTC